MTPQVEETHAFTTGVQWRAGRRGLVSYEEAPSPLAFSAGEVFDGEPGWWTPETLLVAAAEASAMLAFLADAHEKGLGILSYRSLARGVLARDAGGTSRLTELVIKPTVRVKTREDLEPARALCVSSAAASRVCASLKTEPRVEPLVELATKDRGPKTTSTAPARIGVQLSEQHRALDQILSDVEFLGERRSFLPASKRFGEFRRMAQRHFATEEQLFSLLAEHAPEAEALLAQVRAEHAWIERLIESVSAALSQQDYPTFSRRIGELVAALEQHHEREEKLLHPALEEVVEREPDWRRLVEEAAALVAPPSAPH